MFERTVLDKDFSQLLEEWEIRLFITQESMLTLYMAISGGVSWIEPLQPLREAGRQN